jgi:hypothetical protein
MNTTPLTLLGLCIPLLSFGQLAVVTNGAPTDAEIRGMIVGTWGDDGNDRHGRTTFATGGTFISTNWGRAVRYFACTEGVWRVQDGVVTETFTKIVLRYNPGSRHERRRYTNESQWDRTDPDPYLWAPGSVWCTRVISINETGMVGLTQTGTTNRLARIR